MRIPREMTTTVLEPKLQRPSWYQWLKMRCMPSAMQRADAATCSSAPADSVSVFIFEHGSVSSWEFLFLLLASSNLDHSLHTKIIVAFLAPSSPDTHTHTHMPAYTMSNLIHAVPAVCHIVRRFEMNVWLNYTLTLRFSICFQPCVIPPCLRPEIPSEKMDFFSLYFSSDPGYLSYHEKASHS